MNKGKPYNEKEIFYKCNDYNVTHTDDFFNFNNAYIFMMWVSKVFHSTIFN